MDRNITEVEAAKIYEDRFNGGTPRSEAYKWGCRERLQRIVMKSKSGNLPPYKAGSPEFDAYLAGFEHILLAVDVFISRRDEPKLWGKDDSGS